MGRVLDALSWLVTVRPVATLAVLAAITIALGAGIPQRAPQANNEIFLSDDSEVAVALSTIEALFGESAETVSVTLVFRGEALTPEGLAQIERVIEGVTSDERVADVLAAGDAVTSPTEPLAAVLGTDGFEDTTQADIDRVLERIRTEGELAGARAALDSLTGRDADGTPIAIATIRLRDPGDVEALVEAELAIHEIAEAVEGPLAGRSVSPATIDEESDAATGSTMLQLMGLALLVIAALTFLFMRSPSDLLLTLSGLLVTIVWITGAQGWLGPNALGWIGPPNILTTMVPIMVIGLAVDYAIQTVAVYREQRNAGEPVGQAVRRGLRTVTIPLALAAGTTVASFLTNLVSPIPANGDFGITAGLGVGFGLLVTDSGGAGAHRRPPGNEGEAPGSATNLECNTRRQSSIGGAGPGAGAQACPLPRVRGRRDRVAGDRSDTDRLDIRHTRLPAVGRRCMALLGIPYTVVTALITALSIGIGVDYTIHVIHRYKEEFAHLRDPEAAASRTLATTGSALIGSALTTAVGFGVLVFSPLTPFQQFGVVTAITIAYALVAAVLVVPPAMIVWGAYQNLRLRHAVERARTELAEEA